jgi:integrase/recombinase XerD
MTTYRTVARIASELLSDPNLHRRTKTLYEGTLLTFLDEWGSSEISSITREDIEGHLNKLTHLSFRTHNLHQAIIHRLFSFAVERKYIEANPASHLRRRKPDPARGEHSSDEAVRHLTNKEVQLLFKASEPNPRLTALVTLLYESGARISEVLALHLTAIDFEAGQFQVVGKGNKKRWCFFGARGSEALKRYINSERHHPHDALFTERGAYRNEIHPLSYQSAHRELRVVINRYASLKGLRFHDLRHTFATERAQIVPLEVLRALLGHEKIQTTLIYQKITSHVAREAAHAALEKIATS